MKQKKDIGFILYKIFYDDYLAYIGRTKQALQDRIRGHVFHKPMHRSIHIDQVSRIEYAEFKTEADMNLYEIYLILTLKPPLNVDDKTKDYPTVSLPDVTWQTFTTPLWDKWRERIHEAEESRASRRARYREIPEAQRVLRSRKMVGQISEDAYDEEMERLRQEEDELHKLLYG